MLAARLHHFGSIDELRLETVPDPIPTGDEAVVRIAGAGLNRADTEFIKGVYGDAPRADASAWQDNFFPHIPGIEPVGTVEAVTDPAANVKIGDRVLVHSHLSCGQCEFCRSGRDNLCPQMRVLGTQTPGRGAFAERLAFPHDHLLPIPDEMDFVSAATVGVQVATVWWMMKYRASVRPGDIVLVQGAAGGVGVAALQVSRVLGAVPVAVTRSPTKVAALKQAGAETVLVDDGNAGVAQMLRDAYSDGADLVVEAVGGPVWNETLASIKQGGTILVCGAHAGVSVPLNLGLVFGKQIGILGSARAPLSAVREAIELVARGLIRIPVDRVHPLTDIHAALHRLDEGRHFGKIVIDMTHGGAANAAT